MAQILVIDDEEGIREALVEILQRKNYTVQSARNGQDALEMLKVTTELPELIILDMLMPVMDGKTFLGYLIQDPRTGRIPVLIVSGSTDTITALPNHCKYFRKPFPVSELLSAVTEQLENGNGHSRPTKAD